MKDAQPTSIRLTPTLRRQLKFIADKRGTTVSWLITDVMTRWVAGKTKVRTLPTPYNPVPELTELPTEPLDLTPQD